MIASSKTSVSIGENVLKKTIHKGSESIMFSVLQETQYAKPYESSVREIVSNCLDSVTEKNNSIKILKGELKIEDIFIVKEGEEFTESVFDKDYYDTKHLSDNDIVTIEYIENDSATRDRIRFIDRGVGLGGSRLVNYFSLGFSTKRLSKSQLGNFGLGAKSLLSTGVEHYTVTSIYNGKKFVFDITSESVVSKIGKFGDKGNNPVETFYNDYQCYYEVTDEKNSVIVESYVKRHRKADFMSAIEAQLGYIDNLEVVLLDASVPGYKSVQKIKADIKFKTDNIYVGGTDWYAVPQLLLKPGEDSSTLINYGAIAFDELEMKKYQGNVSFIMNINDVDVTPSRESVIWNSRTRKAIKSMFLIAKDTITGIMSDKLAASTNLPDFLVISDDFKASSSASSDYSELAKLVDKSDLDLSYKGFRISEAAAQLDIEGIEEKKNFFVMTTTKGYSNETVYVSDLTFRRIRDFSKNSDKYKNNVLYVGDRKYKMMHKYSKSLYGRSDILLTYMTTDTYTSLLEELKRFDGDMNKYADYLFEGGFFSQVVILETLRACSALGQIILEDDIDRSIMNTAEKEEEADRTRRLTDAERAKITGAMAVKYVNAGYFSYKKYITQQDILNVLEKVPVYVIKSSSKFVRNIYSYSFTRRFKAPILVVSEENYNKIVNIEGVQNFVSSLYTISYGDMELTRLGKALYDGNVREAGYYLDDLGSKGIKESLVRKGFASGINNSVTYEITSRFIEARNKSFRANHNSMVNSLQRSEDLKELNDTDIDRFSNKLRTYLPFVDNPELENELTPKKEY